MTSPQTDAMRFVQSKVQYSTIIASHDHAYRTQHVSIISFRLILAFASPLLRRQIKPLTCTKTEDATPTIRKYQARP